MQNFSLTQTIHVPGAHGAAGRAKAGDRLEIIDIKGKQVGDLMAWVADRDDEWMSPAHTVTQNWRVQLQVGDLIVTNRRHDLFKIVRDDVGYHDIIVPCCDHEAYVRRYGLEGHRSCLGNIEEALAALGETRHTSGELAWNMFMKNKIGSGGEMVYEEPVHGPGVTIVLEVLQDIVFALSSCPQDQTPTNGWDCTEMSVNVWSPAV